MLLAAEPIEWPVRRRGTPFGHLPARGVERYGRENAVKGKGVGDGPVRRQGDRDHGGGFGAGPRVRPRLGRRRAARSSSPTWSSSGRSTWPSRSVTTAGRAIGLRADVGVEADVEAAVRATVEEYGRLDILFANAGKPVEGFGTIPWRTSPRSSSDDVNDAVYKGVFLVRQARLPADEEAGRRRQHRRHRPPPAALNAYPGFGPYNAGKAGAIGLVRSMAYDWGRYGIRVNGLAPTHGMSVNFAMPPDAEVLGPLLRGVRPAAIGRPVGSLHHVPGAAQGRPRPESAATTPRSPPSWPPTSRST